ncbi:MAG: hypothetical protein PVG14_08185 [Anaerolineales bacterium]|jgi:hypothetical protein
MAQEFSESIKSDHDRKRGLWVLIIVLLLIICCICVIFSWAIVWLWNNGDYLLDQLGVISKNFIFL